MGRVVIVWSVVVLITALLMGCWYVTQPMLVNIAHTVANSLVTMGTNSTASDNVLTLSEVVINLFYPILIVGLWFWGYNEAQREDYRGYYQ